MGTIYPRSDHYLPYPEILNKDSYFAVTVGTTQVGNFQENIVFRKIRRAEIKARNTKMIEGQETHPISVNAKYEMN